MKTLFAKAVSAVPLLMTGSAFAQNGNMINGGPGYGWMNGYGWMGGYGGIWGTVLLVILAVGLVAWFVTKKDK